MKHYKKLDLAGFDFDKDFVAFIDNYEKTYMSLYESGKKKRKKFFDNFFFSMD